MLESRGDCYAIWRSYKYNWFNRKAFIKGRHENIAQAFGGTCHPCFLAHIWAGETTRNKSSGGMKSLEYLEWIRTQPCVICLKSGAVEASHLKHVGMGRTRAVPRMEHYTAVSMCMSHHKEYHQSGRREFEENHKINLWEMNALQLRQWLWVKETTT